MSLHITDIVFKDFRSYERFELHDAGRLVVLVGPNAVGKTNVVEGIQLMTALASFRHATIEQMIRHGAPRAQLSLSVGDGNRALEIELSMEDHTRRYRLNGKAKRPVDLRGLVPSVTFTPDDLDLVKGSMSVRRHALDVLGSQLNANYHLIVRDYEKVIRHKNRLLKEEASQALIDSINEMVITCGAQLCCYRAALFKKLKPHVEDRYRRIAAGRENLSVRYTPSWAVDSASGSTAPDADPAGVARADEGVARARRAAPCDFTREEAREHLARALEERRAEETARRRAVVGPHADALDFAIDGMPAGVYGSQGQQRSIVLAYKLAEAAVIEEMLDQKPVLLLDDVMSELDGARRAALVEYIASDVQTFVTTANLAYFDDDMLAAAQVVELPLEGSRSV